MTHLQRLPTLAELANVAAFVAVTSKGKRPFLFWVEV